MAGCRVVHVRPDGDLGCLEITYTSGNTAKRYSWKGANASQRESSPTGPISSNDSVLYIDRDNGSQREEEELTDGTRTAPASQLIALVSKAGVPIFLFNSVQRLAFLSGVRISA